MNKQNPSNPLLCDVATGICGTEPSGDFAGTEMAGADKPLQIIYFTDPICSACWGIEPQLRKLKLEYGNLFEIQYCMGGLLPSWDGFSSGGISSPADVAGHWDEAGDYYQMPIDGDVWLEDPLPSSFPPSVAVKAAQLQGDDKGVAFLRKIRELLYLQKYNICRWEYLLEAAADVGLDTDQFTEDFNHRAQQLFESDLELSHRLGVRGFPTLIIGDREGNTRVINGYQPYERFEQIILTLCQGAEKREYSRSEEGVFTHYNTLTTKEYAVLTGVDFRVADQCLNDLFREGRVRRYHANKGDLWSAPN